MACHRTAAPHRQTVAISARSLDLRAGPIRSYSDTMPKLPPAIRYRIDALLILVPLLGMTYFLFDPSAFNAFMAWLMGIL